MNDRQDETNFDGFDEWPDEALDVDDEVFAAAIEHGRELAQAS